MLCSDERSPGTAQQVCDRQSSEAFQSIQWLTGMHAAADCIEWSTLLPVLAAFSELRRWQAPSSSCLRLQLRDTAASSFASQCCSFCLSLPASGSISLPGQSNLHRGRGKNHLTSCRTFRSPYALTTGTLHAGGLTVGLLAEPSLRRCQVSASHSALSAATWLEHSLACRQCWIQQQGQSSDLCL